MSGIYISGMEMPTEGFVEIIIRDDGTVQQTGQSYRIDGTDYYTPYVGEMPVMYEVIPVPDHGRLIDADALCDGLVNNHPVAIHAKSAPTIIPADREDGAE
jgi:hypothetical protein